MFRVLTRFSWGTHLPWACAEQTLCDAFDFAIPSCDLALLKDPDHVSSGIAEAGGDLGSVAADGLHDLASVCDDHFNAGGHAVDHDVKQKSGLGLRRTPYDPCAADFANRVVKSDAAIPARPDVPAEDAFIELGRARNVGGRHLDVADIAVCECRRHRCSWRGLILAKLPGLNSILAALFPSNASLFLCSATTSTCVFSKPETEGRATAPKCYNPRAFPKKRARGVAYA